LLNQKTDNLVNLILSLTKGEKRNFSLIAKKASRDIILYQKLYEHILYYKKYDAELILKKLPQIKKSQLSNITANLYKQILRSLRDIHKENYLEIKAREHFDFAKVLYAKGQYIIKNLQLTDQLSNLSLMMYGKYLQLGVVRDETERQELTTFIEEHIPPNIEAIELDFYQRLYLYQSYVWYYTMLQDFAKYYKYAQRWVNLFDANPEMQKIEIQVSLCIFWS